MSYSMPLVGPAYCEPPWIWKDAVSIFAPFETDVEALRKFIPEPLKLAEKPRLSAWVCDYPWVTGTGPYLEAFIIVEATFNGTLGRFCPFIWTTSDVATTSGRETMGFPKKNAKINLKWESEVAVGRVERCGLPIMTVAVRTDKKVNTFDKRDIQSLSGPIYLVKLIPGVPGEPHVIHEIVALTVEQDKLHWIIEGDSTVHFEPSPADPTYLLTPRNMFKGYYYKYDYGTKMTSKVVYRYDKK